MNSPRFHIVIPARFASTRLPGKPLLDLGGMPMVVRVAKRVASVGAASVLVATDHDAVLAACHDHGISAIRTRGDHATGTDRLSEVVQQQGFGDNEIVVNVQGDEPLISPDSVSATALLLATSKADIATAAYSLNTVEDFLNPNAVKVVCRADGEAMYFSRAPIPYPRDAFSKDKDHLPENFPALRHVGLYAYTAKFLKAFSALPEAPTEHFEALEQLRALWHGYKILVHRLPEAPAAGVDTPEDAAKMQAWFDQHENNR